MKTRDKVRYIKKMLHLRGMERGYFLADVPYSALTDEAHHSLQEHAVEIATTTTLFPKKCKRGENGYTIMFYDGSM